MTKSIFNSKWYVLALTFMTVLLICGAQRMSIVVLFKDISLDLNLSLVAIGTIWGMDPLAGVFVSIPSGMIIDRFGIKRTMIVATLLGGLFGASRGFATDFVTMAIAVFLFGIISAALPSLAPKVAAVWFSGKRLGMINALLFVAIILGQVIGTMMSATVLLPLLGGWRQVLWIYSIPVFLIALLWITTPRDPVEVNQSSARQTLSLREMLPRVVRIKEVWIYGLVMISTSGVFTAMAGYLPIYLRDSGWTTAGADGALTLMMVIGGFTTFPIMTLVERLRTPKTILALNVIMIGITVGIMSIASGGLFWAVLILYGIVRGIPVVIGGTLIIRTKGVGSKLAGTASGLANTVTMLGGFLFPPIGNSLAQFNPGWPFILWGVLSILLLIGLLFIRKSVEVRE